MSRRPSAAENVARKAAAMAAEMESDESQESADETPKRRGRPPGAKREIFSRTTVNLDKARYDALEKTKNLKGVSVHALILMGIDLITKRPEDNVWDK